MIDETVGHDITDVMEGKSYKMLAACGALPTGKDDELGVKRVRTHIPALDELTNGGLLPGLHCVTGGPASYKTASMLQMAYHVALDGQEVLYITDEIGKQECLYRLIAHQLQLDCVIAGEMADAPAWTVMGEAINGAVNGADERALEKIAEAARKVAESKLRIVEMGPRIKSYRLLPREFIRKGCHLVRKERCEEDNEYVCHNARYLPSLYLDASSECGGTGWEEFDELCGSSALVVIDAVNQLRLWKWTQGYDEEKSIRYTDYSELTTDRRTHMDEVVESLDRMGRKEGIAVVGIFHTARTGSYPRHPSMSDFKETSGVEFHASCALKFVRYADMDWKGHPKAPFPPGEEAGEAVGLFVLKNRAGKRTEPNRPIPLVADGAHNLVTQYE